MECLFILQEVLEHSVRVVVERVVIIVGVAETMIAHFDPGIRFVHLEVSPQSLAVLRIETHHEDIDLRLLVAHSVVHVFTAFQRPVIECEVDRPCRRSRFLGFVLRCKWTLDDAYEQAGSEEDEGASQHGNSGSMLER